MTKATKQKRSSVVSHRDVTVAMFKRDSALAAEYLNQILAGGDRDELLLALRYMADAFGGIPAIAEKAGRNHRTLYRTLSPKGNPELGTLTAVLHAMGLRIAIEPLPRRRAMKTA